MDRANVQWSSHASQTERILDVTQGELTWIVGTIYLDMPLKPQVLQDLISDVNLAAAVPQRVWRDPSNDTIQLEDESGRISLVGHKLSEQMLCTGIVVAVLGSETTSEEFNVIDIIFPETIEVPIDDTSPKQALSSGMTTKNGSASETIQPENAEDSFVAFVSGLDLDGGQSSSISLDLLQEMLTGELLNEKEQLSVSRICSLVIVGNSLCPEAPVLDDAMARRLNKNKKYGYDSSSFNPRPIGALDDFLTEICKSINVVLLPGEQDPTNSTLPQQAINPIMMRQASRYSLSSLRLTTNPAYLQFGNRTMFCTSGQTIDNIAHYIPDTTLDDSEMKGGSSHDYALCPLDIAENTLRWRHSAPTAPDTLWTYPYADRDPFVFEDCPDVYIVGNQDTFDCRTVDTRHQTEASGTVVSRCLMISLPRFSRTGQVVLVNVRSLECEVLNFQCDSYI